jgi:hypothetical protein
MIKEHNEEAKIERLARIQAFEDAITIMRFRLDIHKTLYKNLIAITTIEDCIVFLEAELERSINGTSIPGNPGSTSSLA